VIKLALTVMAVVSSGGKRGMFNLIQILKGGIPSPKRDFGLCSLVVSIRNDNLETSTAKIQIAPRIAARDSLVNDVKPLNFEDGFQLVMSGTYVTERFAKTDTKRKIARESISKAPANFRRKRFRRIQEEAHDRLRIFLCSTTFKLRLNRLD
jgi:hypothetical protein